MARRWPIALVWFLAVVVVFGQELKTTHAPADTRAAPSQNLPGRELLVNGMPLGQAVEPRANDICIVCKRPLGTEGVVYLVNGQRVPLHFVVCYNVFEKNPRKFLAALQPRGAFLGTGGQENALSFAWFLGGLYVLTGLVFAALCANRALTIGRSPAAWFAAGLALNAFGYLILLTRSRQPGAAGVPEGLGKIATTYAPIPCPQCGALNHPAADKCLECGGTLQSTVGSEVRKAGLQSN
ncbi:MAG: hypothetical protein ACM3NO_07590 [Deltaproteobacteria bacterium]